VLRLGELVSELVHQLPGDLASPTLAVLVLFETCIALVVEAVSPPMPGGIHHHHGLDAKLPGCAALCPTG
jgi:hypothetical protein